MGLEFCKSLNDKFLKVGMLLVELGGIVVKFLAE